MHVDHLADDDEGRAGTGDLAGDSCCVAKRGESPLLIRRRRICQKSDGVEARPARLDQRAGDPANLAKAHVENERVGSLSEACPIDIAGSTAASVMAGDEGDGLGGGALGRGNAGIGRRGDTGGDTRNNAERNGGGGQRQRFLATAAEHEGVAVFEPDHAAASGCMLNQ